VINPPADEDLEKAWQLSHNPLPTLWLLGKTGAGKSSIVQQMTGQTAAEIGNGFMPCTVDSRRYDFPLEQPILRFMDTRGLGEASYDPAADIAALGKTSQALLIVMRLLDGEHSAVLDALHQIRRLPSAIQRDHAMVVYTAGGEIDNDHDLARAIAPKQALIEEAWGRALEHVVVDFSELADGDGLDNRGAEQLNEMIVEKLPELSLWLLKTAHADTEQSNYLQLRSEVLWYASAAATSDTIPAVGLVSVPGIQGKMLHSLAQHYGIAWSKRNFSEFTAALGTSLALRYAISLVGRQLAKLLPGVGQVAGSALAFTLSYASTYAIGRAACSYLYHQKTNTPLDDDALKEVYQNAIAEGKAAGEDMKGQSQK
jgi:uncharacterized protein (DUF697 family)